MLILECESLLEAEGDGKPLETHSAVLANDMFTARGSTKQLFKHSILLAEELEGSFADTPISSETIFGAAGMGGLEDADEVINELRDEVVESARTPGITTKGGTDKSSFVPAVSSDPSSEDLTSLSLALKTPLPEDDEPFSEDELFTLSLALNTPLPVDTEFDSEQALPTPDIGKESSLEVGDDKPLLEAPLGFANVRSADSTIPTKAIFAIGKPIKPVRKNLLLAKKPEISFADASVSPGAVFVSTGYGRLDSGDEVVEELKDEVVVGARIAGATAESTNKSFCVQVISSQDLENSLSLALTTPLPDDEFFSEDESFTLSLALNTPLPVDTEFDSERALPTPDIGKESSVEAGDDKPLFEAPLYFANVRPTNSTIPMEAIFAIWKSIKQLRQSRCRLSKEPEIAFVNPSVSQEVVFDGMGTGGLGDRLEGTNEVVGGLEGEAIVSACLLGIIAKNGTNKLRGV